MKKLLTILFALILISSCSPEITRISYKGSPLNYKDIQTNGELKIEDNTAYMRTISGLPMVVDLNKFDIEKRKGKIYKPNTFNIIELEKINIPTGKEITKND